MTVVRVPEGIDEAELRQALVSRHGLEISAGIGRLAGRVWRIGLMGAACSAQHIVKCVQALDEELGRRGFRVTGDGQAAALAVLENNHTS